MFFYKCKSCRVPNSITTSLKSGPAATAWKRRSIRLTLCKFLSAQAHNNTTVISRNNKTVMLFCSISSHRLEPVGKMRCTFFNCPFFHGMCNLICNIKFKRSSILNSFFQGLECIFRQTFLHYLEIKDIASIKFLNALHHTLHKI